MLNRIFILAGVVAILLLAAAFVLPGLVPWNNFRDRLSAMAGEVLGTPVRIEGEVTFALLPQPRLTFSGVSAGPVEAPKLEVETVEAEFSLIDFLRDRYTVTRLVLSRPQVTVVVDAEGIIETGLGTPVSDASVAVTRAEIVDGGATLRDDRSGAEEIIDSIAGEIRFDGAGGGFSFQGGGARGAQPFFTRVSMGAAGGDGSLPVSLSLGEGQGGAAVTVEGRLLPGASPKLSGNLTYRQPPPILTERPGGDVGRGNLALTGTIEATPSRILISDYVLVPDENRATTRLQGAAEVALGASSRFNAVVSGGVLSLPPSDPAAEAGTGAYEIVRLLSSLPAVPIPPIPGTVGLDIADVDLGAFSIRNIRLDAEADAEGWRLRSASGTLPGDARISVDGRVTAIEGRPEFSGNLSLDAPRLDLLAAQWRRPDPGNPLFNVPGRLEARLDLVGETLSVSDGKLVIDGESSGFSAQLGLGAVRDLHLSADLGTLDAARSASLFALLPEIDDGALAASFPQGEFDVVADAIALDGLDARALVARGSWDGGVLVFNRLSAGELGGAALDFEVTAFGSFDRPEVSGAGVVRVAAGDTPFVDRILDNLRAPPHVAAFVRRFAPVDIAFRLTAPSGAGGQSLMLSGNFGGAQLAADIDTRTGLLRLFEGRVETRFELQGPDPAALSAQLGLPAPFSVAEGVPMRIVGQVAGEVASTLETTLLVTAGTDSVGFSGHLSVSDPTNWNGRGSLQVGLEDTAPLAGIAGIEGIWIPAIAARGILEFEGGDAIRVSEISGTSGASSFSGDLSYRQSPQGRAVSGAIAIDRLDLGDVARLAAGPAATISGDGTWPVGPLSVGPAQRGTTGNLEIAVSRVFSADRLVAESANAVLGWSATETFIRRMEARLGDGLLGGDVTLCCAGTAEAKRLDARVQLDRVSVDQLLTADAAAGLDGRLSGVLQVEGIGGSIAEIVAALGGEGSFSLTDISIAELDPKALDALAGVDDLVNADAVELGRRVEAALAVAPFVSTSASGSISLAAGTVRSPNLSLRGDGGTLFGTAVLALPSLGLSGSFELSRDAAAVTPVAEPTASTGAISVGLAGSLVAPARTVDATRLVDAAMMRAFEAEVERLERLRAEDEARRRAAEEEAARMRAEQQRQAEEAARRAEEAAARRAAEEELARRAAEEAARAGQPMQLAPPIDLGL